jgi:hypothetical protein
MIQTQRARGPQPTPGIRVILYRLASSSPWHPSTPTEAREMEKEARRCRLERQQPGSRTPWCQPSAPRWKTTRWRLPSSMPAPPAPQLPNRAAHPSPPPGYRGGTCRGIRQSCMIGRLSCETPAIGGSARASICRIESLGRCLHVHITFVWAKRRPIREMNELEVGSATTYL